LPTELPLPDVPLPESELPVSVPPLPEELESLAELAPSSEAAVLDNEVATELPTVRTDAAASAPIRLATTAYSTAVGPSSAERNLRILESGFIMLKPSSTPPEGK
jgi:hypothetical protein